MTRMASSSGIRKAVSTFAVSMIGVTRPSPMPSVIESPGVDLATPFVNNSYIRPAPARVGARGDDVLVLFLQIAADSGERTARSDRADEPVDLAVGLRPDFRAG